LLSSSSNGWRLRRNQVGVLLDRCVVGDPQAKELRSLPNLKVLTLDDAYGTGAGERIPDVQFLEDAGRHGWMVWSQNPKMWHVTHERKVIQDWGTHVFSLANAQHLAFAKGFIFGRHYLSVVRRHRRPEPCFWRLYVGRAPLKDLR